MKKSLALLSLPFILIGCSTTSEVPAPVDTPKTVSEGTKQDGVGGPNPVPQGRSYRPVASNQVAIANTNTTGVQVQPYQQEQQQKVTPVYSAPVVSLLKQADAYEQSGNLVAASTTLDRALNIEKKNANLWNKMAELRIKQGDFPGAVEMAKKSNVLAGGNPELRQKNWHLIAEARRMMGNEAGAREAEQKAFGVY